MTVFDMCCDGCGTALLGPAGADEQSSLFGRRFTYHPGDWARKDDAGLLCGTCWSAATAWLGERAAGRCTVCRSEVDAALSLHVHRPGDPLGWQLCKPHAVAFLNRLRTVEPKLDAGTFTLAGDWPGP